jgi:hypothetical protein
MSADKNEMANVVLPVLEKCFGSDWNMTYAEMVADALIAAGYRQIFDGDCGLSSIKTPDDRESAEAWMRWANLAMDDSLGAIGAMKQMLTELGYRKHRTITTRAEQVNLPNGTMVETNGDIFQHFNGYWFAPGSSYNHHLDELSLPLTVIHEATP